MRWRARVAIGLMVAAQIALAPAAEAATPACAAGYVVLTFDDGPSLYSTPRLVKILAERRVPATFFMVGERVRDSPEQARQVAAAGLQVANHTWSHPHLTRRGDSTVRWQLRATGLEIRRLGIRPTNLMRPPYGDIGPRVNRIVRADRLVPVLWTADSKDWKGGDAKTIANTVLGKLKPHGTNIVLQHDGINNSPASVAAVPKIVHDARARGYCFTTLDANGRPLVPRPPPVVTPPAPAATPPPLVPAPTPTADATLSAVARIPAVRGLW